MKRTILPILPMLLLSLSLLAQQESQFTQFSHYKMGINPGYAGSTESIALTGMVRNQWMGLEGAPQTQLLSFTMPMVNQRVGIGVNISRQTIGVSERLTADLAYAYRIKVPRGFLGMGLQASMRSLRVDYSNLISTQPSSIDESIPQGVQTKFVPNFGAGIYYDASNFFIGFSVPRLLSANIDLADNSGIIDRETPQAYLMGGATIPLSGKTLQLQPQILMKYIPGAPFDADVNINLLINNTFTAGATYRVGGSRVSGVGESMALIFGMQVSESLLFSVSYDATLSELRNYNSGTLEGVVRYLLIAKETSDEVENPRGFYD